MFYCKTLDAANTCVEWVEAVNPFIPALSAQEGIELGGMILGVLVAAYTLRLIRNLILNR